MCARRGAVWLEEGAVLRTSQHSQTESNACIERLWEFNRTVGCPGSQAGRLGCRGCDFGRGRGLGGRGLGGVWGGHAEGGRGGWNTRSALKRVLITRFKECRWINPAFHFVSLIRNRENMHVGRRGGQLLIKFTSLMFVFCLQMNGNLSHELHQIPELPTLTVSL